MSIVCALSQQIACICTMFSCDHLFASNGLKATLFVFISSMQCHFSCCNVAYLFKKIDEKSVLPQDGAGSHTVSGKPLSM
eukprot:scaffold34245_cov23-Tisochrysis_lutea.AAC.2